MLCIVFAITIARNLSSAWRVMAALAAEDTASSLMPSEEDAKRPAGGPDTAVQYLPAGLPQDLSDAFAVVGSTRLPLHSQVLAMAASVLRDVFVTQEESGQQGTLDLSQLFSGHALRDVTLFLRWAYSPQLASQAELQAESASLNAVLQLAHKLDAPALLHKLPQYWMGVALDARPGELLRYVALADGCSLLEFRARCVALLAQKLRAEGPGWRERASETQLVDCGQEPLLDLLGGWLAHSRAREVLEVAGPKSSCSSSDTFGYTWALQAFSQRSSVAVSPWVAVGGHIWRLSLYPQGLNDAVGTHVSAFLWCALPRASKGLQLSVDVKLTVLDQSFAEQHFTGQLVTSGKPFSSENDHWGRNQFMPLSQLREGALLLNDRMLLKIEITLHRDPACEVAQLPVFDAGEPERFYLPAHLLDAARPQLSDTSVTVEGVQLPLHSQVLTVRAGACLEALGSGLAGGETSEAQDRVQGAFGSSCSGHAAHDVAAFLRLLYSPQLAEQSQLAALGPQLPTLLRLAHALRVEWLQKELEGHAAGLSARTPPLQLWHWAAAASECQLGDAAAHCLRALAQQLLALGSSWELATSRGLLAANLRLAARLVSGMLATCDPSSGIFNVRDGSAGGTGGFMWVLPGYSRRAGEALSPWVTICGVEWRLEVFPKGDQRSGGTHVSAFLGRKPAESVSPAEPAEVAACVEIWVLDQGPAGLHFQRTQAVPDVYTTGTTRTWGQSRFMPLSELQRPERQFLAGDRLVWSVEIRLVG